MSSHSLAMPAPTVPNKPFTHFKLISFDIFGTLIDWDSSVVPHLSHLTALHPSNGYHDIASNRSTQLRAIAAFMNHEHELQDAHPGMSYDQLLTEAYLATARDWSIPVSPEVQQRARDFGNSIGSWPAFPDTVAAARSLAKHFKLVPLSNVDKRSFHATLTGPLGDVPFWRHYTAEEIGSYKPDLKNFRYLLHRVDEEAKREDQGIGIDKADVLHVANSLRADHVPAKQMGMSSVWIDRRRAHEGGDDKDVDGSAKTFHGDGKVGYGWRFRTLGEFADEVERQFQTDKMMARDT